MLVCIYRVNMWLVAIACMNVHDIVSLCAVMCINMYVHAN